MSWRHRHWLLAAILFAAVAVIGLLAPRGANATRDPIASDFITLDLPVPPLPVQTQDTAPPDADIDWRTVSVQPGQTVGAIFHAQGVSGNDLHTLLLDSANKDALVRIHPGEEFAFAHATDGHLTALRFDRDEKTQVTVTFDAKGMHQSTAARDVERRSEVAHGIITDSLFDAANRAGMDDAMVIKLADAFGYDIDFAQDLRPGDSFTVIYDSVWREGEKLRDGDILAAYFVNRGKRFSAIRYTDSRGGTMFYSADGRPLRKSFLRTPVAFTRISSFFSLARLHPILGYTRAHQGVDYAAPTGTPVHAAGDGRIVFRGWQHGYGNVVIIDHGRHFSTLYGHMSRFANERVGQHVSQGQTIGFVGMTGLATGPHLHYEFRVDGVHRNPLTVTLPKPEPLPAAEFARFKRESSPMLAKLDKLDSLQLASAK
ncbi:MAG: peptidoglycan DD-metalloendopeptidase family protein [Proteobacteria bacterium]|nr:peptidoglycan DD-metalloendopeptidase family protein [Pseudomonadota bacterium]